MSDPTLATVALIICGIGVLIIAVTFATSSLREAESAPEHFRWRRLRRLLRRRRRQRDSAISQIETARDVMARRKDALAKLAD